MQDISVKQVTINDLAELQRISRQTFSETFSNSNSEKDMAKYLETNFAIEKLSAELSNPNSYFYFAMCNGEVIGYLKLNSGKAQTEHQNDQALEIERIYVSAIYHGRKVGQLLCTKAIQVAKELYVSYVWLGVWEHNLRAISFYQKNGFTEFDKHVFRLGESEQIDKMMKKVLV